MGRTPKTLLFVCKKKIAKEYKLDFVDEEEREKLGLKHVSKGRERYSLDLVNDDEIERGKKGRF